MKVIKQQKVTVELTKEEVNAILFGLNDLLGRDFLHDTFEYHGFGGQRQFKVHKLRQLLLQFSNL